MKRAADTASRAGGAIERFIERTLAPRLEALAGEVRGLRGELGQFDNRLTANITSPRNETMALRNELIARIEAVNSRIDSSALEFNQRLGSLRTEVNLRIHGLTAEVGARFEAVNTRIDALTQRVDDALSIRERLIALENRFPVRNS